MYHNNQEVTEDLNRQRQQAKILASRMRLGTASMDFLQGNMEPILHIMSIKDYAAYERDNRDQQNMKRQAELERRRLAQLERENSRWQRVESGYIKEKEKYQNNFDRQMLGIKRTPNSNGLAYNPINLQYQRNPQGEKLKTRDEDHKIRGYVRAHNMDFRGNSKYNPITGQDRLGIEKVIPNELNDRFNNKLYDHYDGMKLKVPSSSNDTRMKKNYNYY